MQRQSQRHRPEKRTYSFMSSTDKAIDVDNEEVREAVNKQDHSMLAYILVKKGRTDEALSVLKAKKTKFSISRIKETVHRYMHAGDFAGGLKYIKSFSGKIPDILPLESIIKIYLEQGSEDIDAIVATNVMAGLERCFDRHLLDVLKHFYLLSQDKQTFRGRFDRIHGIIMQLHYTSLKYDDCKCLFKLMPVKLPYLQRMVELNPFIKRKYYFLYANAFGIQKKDITRILAVRYSTWAMSIAVFYGWVDESARRAFEEKQGEAPMFLNETGNWKWGVDDSIRFSRKYDFG